MSFWGKYTVLKGGREKRRKCERKRTRKDRIGEN
jgi:hypothetical protein